MVKRYNETLKFFVEDSCQFPVASMLSFSNGKYVEYSDYEKLEQEIVRLKAENEWVSVKDRLPPEGEWFLVYTNSLVNFLFFDGVNEGGVHWLGDGDWEHKVTHWKPLPAPPGDKS